MSKHKKFKVNQHALLKNSAGKILILKDEDEALWMLPGGHVDDDTSSKDALLREIMEETGISNALVEEVVYTAISDSGKTFLLTYRMSVPGEPEIVISHEHTDYAWVNMDNVDEYEYRHPATREMIVKALG